MRINNNLMAMNTHRQLSLNSDNGAKSIEKLSSGYRINRAGDDAAGLAITEKMRAQIRGLTQASRNAQDSISLVQTAEGALQETQSILQRMRELAVQSANDTNVDADRASMQNEVNQLASEITRIADNTEFNTKNLLDGTFKGTFHIGSNANQAISLTIGKVNADALGVAGKDAAQFEVYGTVTDTAAGGTGLAVTNGDYTIIKKDDYKGTAIDYATNSATTEANTSYIMLNASGAAVATSADGLTFTELAAANRDTVVFNNKVVDGTVKISATGATGATGTASITGGKLEAGTYTVKDISSNPIYGSNWTYGLVDGKGNVVALGATDLSGTAAAADPANVTNWVSTNDYSVAMLTVVSNADVDLNDTITVTGEGIDISTKDAANVAIDAIDDALVSVSDERAKLGATQNRLEHTIKNLDTSAENLQAAESRIRDVDMAKEMMEFTKNNILQQAAQAMLAQANQAPQGVLQLLR